jgi:hypothetical protein
MYRLCDPMKLRTRRLFAPWLVALAMTAGCKGKTDPPVAPTAPTLNVAGAWRGTADDSSGPGSITMQVTQSGENLTGTVAMSVTTVAGRGTVAGSVSGTSTIRLTITIPAGGFDAPFGSCTATVTGTGQATATSITATYTGTNSCSGPITKGELTLSKG